MKSPKKESVFIVHEGDGGCWHVVVTIVGIFHNHAAAVAFKESLKSKYPYREYRVEEYTYDD